jgi:hypothetical protein
MPFGTTANIHKSGAMLLLQNKQNYGMIKIIYVTMANATNLQAIELSTTMIEKRARLFCDW